MADLHLVGSDIVFANPKGKERITVVDGQFKKCLAFGLIEGGLLVILREGGDGIASDKRRSSRRDGREAKKSGGAKTANGTPLSIDAKRTLSVCSFDAASSQVNFHTHVSIDGWSTLSTSRDSPFIVLSDYNTAHSAVLEWTPNSKTLRRVWEGKGSCPHHYKVNDTHYILLLLYTARRLSLCAAKTMEEVAECSANGRDKEIADVLVLGDRAFVIYGSGACSVFSLAEDAVRRLVDLGKILDGKLATKVAQLDDTDAVILYKDGLDDVCLLEPINSADGRGRYDKTKAAKALFKSSIAAANRISTGGNIEDGADTSTSATKKEKKEKVPVKAPQLPTAPADSNTDEGLESNGGGIGLLALVGITAAAMVITTAIVMKIATK